QVPAALRPLRPALSPQRLRASQRHTGGDDEMARFALHRLRLPAPTQCPGSLAARRWPLSSPLRERPRCRLRPPPAGLARWQPSARSVTGGLPAWRDFVSLAAGTGEQGHHCVLDEPRRERKHDVLAVLLEEVRRPARA